MHKNYCIQGHCILKWNSQPLLGKMPAANLLTSAAITLSGETFKHISHFFQLFGLRFISQSNHDNIQKQFVLCSINEA